MGVGITIAIRSSKNAERVLYYYRVPENWRKTEKLKFLTEKNSIVNIEWQNLQPDIKHNWLTESIQADFDTFLPMGTKEAKGVSGMQGEAIFKTYSLGVVTSRDNYVYSYDAVKLGDKARTFVDLYNGVVDSAKRRELEADITYLINTTDIRIKWSRQVKASLMKFQYSQYEQKYIRNSIYRPFTRKYLYFDDFWNEERYQQPLIFPTSMSETENIIICTASIGADHQTFFATNIIPDSKCGISGNSVLQTFPYYIYTKDGSIRRENITDWALAQFQAKYDTTVSKWDIFHYTYAMLHHPQYRERYTEKLKRDLPHIPLLANQEAFTTCIRIGKRLMDLHLHYEDAQEYPLNWLENKEVPINWRVEKMRLTPDKSTLKVNDWLTLSDIPQMCYQYRLGNRSALEWVIDQYQVSTDTRSGIVNNPNSDDDEQYIVRLVGKVITVSVETVKLIEELTQAVTQRDWISKP